MLNNVMLFLVGWRFFLLQSYTRVWPSIQHFKYVFIIYLMEAHTNSTFITSFDLFHLYIYVWIFRGSMAFCVAFFLSNWDVSNAKRLFCLIFGSFCNVSRSRHEQRLIYGRKEEKLLRLSCAFFLGRTTWEKTRTPMGAIRFFSAAANRQQHRNRHLRAQPKH